MKFWKLIRLLRTAQTIEELDSYRDAILKWFPVMERTLNYDQKNSAHHLDLWHHSLQTVVNLPKDVHDDMLYIAALLHDVGKPECQVEDVKYPGVMHYYGHPQISAEIVSDECLPFLEEHGVGLSKDEKRRLIYYTEYHDDHVSLRRKHLRRHLLLGFSLEEFQNLMKLQVADAKAHVILPVIQDRIDICTKLSGPFAYELYCEIVKEGKH